MHIKALLLAIAALMGIALASSIPTTTVTDPDVALARPVPSAAATSFDIHVVRDDRPKPPKSQCDRRCHTPFWNCVGDCKKANWTDCERVCNCKLFNDKKFLCVTHGCTKLPEACPKDDTKPQETCQHSPAWAADTTPEPFTPGQTMHQHDFHPIQQTSEDLLLSRQSHLSCDSCTSQTQQCQYMCKGNKKCEDTCNCQVGCPARCYHCGKCSESCPKASLEGRDSVENSDGNNVGHPPPPPPHMVPPVPQNSCDVCHLILDKCESSLPEYPYCICKTSKYPGCAQCGIKCPEWQNPDTVPKDLNIRADLTAENENVSFTTRNHASKPTTLINHQPVTTVSSVAPTRCVKCQTIYNKCDLKMKMLPPYCDCVTSRYEGCAECGFVCPEKRINDGVSTNTESTLEIGLAVPPPYSCASCTMFINKCKKECGDAAECDQSCTCHVKLNNPMCKLHCDLKCDLGKRAESIQDPPLTDVTSISGSRVNDEVQTGIGGQPNRNSQCQVVIDNCIKSCTGATCKDACHCQHYKTAVCKEAKIKCNWPWDFDNPA